MDWLDLLAVQKTLKSLLQHHNLKASILWCSAFFMVQLSHPYMTTRKTIALTRQKVISLLFNTLSRFVTTFFPRSNYLLFGYSHHPHWIWSSRKENLSLFPFFSREVMGPDAMIFIFWMLSFKPNFSLSCFTFIKSLFSFSSLLP